MKRNAKVIAIVLVSVVLIIVIIVLEKNSKTPMERYLERTQTFGQINSSSVGKLDESNNSSKEIVNYANNLKYEFLSYELIDDKDITKQTKYKDEFFIEGKVPPSDYIVEYIDHDAMARDYPKYDEYRKSHCDDSVMTEAEYEEFMREHKADYTTDKHIKTKYLFVKCRITYIGNGRNEEWLSNIKVFAMKGNKILGETGLWCFFDHSQHTTREERDDMYFIYRFEKVGDCIECILGCRLREDRIDLSEGTTFYLGFQPSVMYSDEDQFNPAIDNRCVALYDIPKEG